MPLKKMLMAWKKKDYNRDEKRPMLKPHTRVVMILCVCISLVLLWKVQKEAYGEVVSCVMGLW